MDDSRLKKEAEEIEFAKILIVDDEEDVCLLMKRLLSTRGYNAMCCFNLKSCYQTLSEIDTIDFILLDINLTDGNGLSLLEENVVPSESKVIVMSARAHLAEEALAKGADQFIAKPFSPFELIDMIDEFRKAG